MNPDSKYAQQNHESNEEIRKDLTNPLLTNMNNCPYYGWQEKKDEENSQYKMSSQNPYFAPQKDEQVKYIPINQSTTSYDQIKLFQNASQIPMKKKQQKNQQQAKEQQYIKLRPDGKGQYARYDGNNSQKSQDCCTNCCNEQCCSQACVQVCCRCLCEVGLMLICEMIFRK